MEVALRVALAAAATALAALLAHDARAVYHDGLRLLVRDAAEGRATRSSVASQGWRMSLGFILWFALPVSLLSGIPIAHLLFLPADLIGVRIPVRSLAVVMAAAFGAVLAMIVAGAGAFVQRLPDGIADTPDVFGGTAALLVPVIPIVAAMRLSPLRYGLASGALGVGSSFLATWLSLDSVVLPTALACIPLVVYAAPVRHVDVTLDAFAEQLGRIQTSMTALVPFAMLVGGLAGLLFLAGEPLAAWLLVSDRPSAAATVAVLTAGGSMPLVAMSSMSAGVYSTQGYPDWLLAPGYLARRIFPGALLAAVIMFGEAYWLRRIAGLIIRHPEISSVAAALRAASEDVLVVTGVLGGALSAFRNWADPGLLGFAALCLANEVSGRRIPALAIGPAAILLLVLLHVASDIVVP